MKERKGIRLTHFLILLIAFLIILIGYLEVSFEGDNKRVVEKDKIFCQQSERDKKACIEIYKPVCGWKDPAKVQCIKYPCAQTFSNNCFACSEENVLYYTEGECPNE